MARDAADLGAKLGALGNAVPKRVRAGLFAASMDAKETALGDYRRAGVSPSGESRLGRWGVGFNISKDRLMPRSLVSVRGRKMHLFENPTKAHSLKPRRRKKTNPNKVINIPGVGYRRGGQHPGTRGARVFHGTSRPKIERDAPKHIMDAISSGMAKIFRRS